MSTNGIPYTQRNVCSSQTSEWHPAISSPVISAKANSLNQPMPRGRMYPVSIETNTIKHYSQGKLRGCYRDYRQLKSCSRHVMLEQLGKMKKNGPGFKCTDNSSSSSNSLAEEKFFFCDLFAVLNNGLNTPVQSTLRISVKTAVFPYSRK